MKSAIVAVFLLLKMVAANSERVQVDVYYESTCPDSIKFINSQLYPALTTVGGGNLSHYVQLQLVPFGKSSYKRDSINELEFTCHHGPEECRGNKIHACAIDKIGNSTQPSPGLGYNTATLDYINCLMEKVDRTNRSDVKFPTKECGARVQKVNNVNEIETCSQHTIGVQLLEHYGELTDKLQKPLKGVPTIVFDGRYDEEDNSLAQKNFVAALCRHINGDKPAECAKNGANVLHLPVLLLLSFITFYFTL